MPDLAIPMGAGTEASSPSSPREALAQLEAVIRALPRSALLPMNVDGLHVMSVVLDAAPAFLALRPRMLTLGPELNLWLIDHCVPLAHAYCAASTRYIPRNEARTEFKRARREGMALRHRLRDELDSLIQYGVLKGEVSFTLEGGRGTRALAHDLTALARVFDEEKNVLAGRTSIGSTETARAAELAVQLLAGCFSHRKRSAAEEDAWLLKRQAFTLLCEAYREVRRAVCFLRDREGDAECIAPLPYAERSSKRNTRTRTSADSKSQP